MYTLAMFTLKSEKKYLNFLISNFALNSSGKEFHSTGAAYRNRISERFLTLHEGPAKYPPLMRQSQQKSSAFSRLLKCLRSLYGKSVDSDQTAPIGAVCSGSTLFASILNSSVMLGNYLQQTTSADDIFRCVFFLGALRVRVSKIIFVFLLKRSECTGGASPFKISKVSNAMVLILWVSRVGKFALVNNSM